MPRLLLESVANSAMGCFTQIRIIVKQGNVSEYLTVNSLPVCTCENCVILKLLIWLAGKSQKGFVRDEIKGTVMILKISEI